MPLLALLSTNGTDCAALSFCCAALTDAEIVSYTNSFKVRASIALPPIALHGRRFVTCLCADFDCVVRSVWTPTRSVRRRLVLLLLWQHCPYR